MKSLNITSSVISHSALTMIAVMAGGGSIVMSDQQYRHITEHHGAVWFKGRMIVVTTDDPKFSPHYARTQIVTRDEFVMISGFASLFDDGLIIDPRLVAMSDTVAHYIESFDMIHQYGLGDEWVMFLFDVQKKYEIVQIDKTTNMVIAVNKASDRVSYYRSIAEGEK